MSYVWVQQWVALPVIVEEHMGDTSHDTGLGQSGPLHQQHTQDDSHPSFAKPEGSFQPSRTPSGHTPFFSQYSTLPSSQHRMDNSRYPYAAGGNTSQPGSSLNMSAITSALPDYSSQPQSNTNPQPQYQDQRRLSGASTPAVVYQMQQNLQYPHQTGTNFGGQTGQSGFGHSQYSGYSPGQGAQGGNYPQLQQHRMGGMSQPYSGYSPISPQYYYYPTPTTAYPSMSFTPGGPMQSSIPGRSMTGTQGSLHAESQEGFLGMEGYPGKNQAKNLLDCGFKTS
jgi:hypothetical protein